MSTFVIEPVGPFSLAAARRFADGFPAGIGGGGHLAEAWRPYRMWAIVLLRFSANREATAPEPGTA
jgi:hypothetical protein